MAQVKILVEGYTNADKEGLSGQEKTCPTVTLVREKDIVMVVDPGVMSSQQMLIDALEKEGLTVNDVTIVAITQSHVGHTRNVGMFPKARVLECFGIWDKDRVEDWQEHFSEDIQILKTPGHDRTCITLFVKVDNDGIVAICGDVFWRESGPEVDLHASDMAQLLHSRQLVLKMSHWIIPGHGPMYKTENGRRLIPGKKAEAISLGKCRSCGKPFLTVADKCVCQEWLCFRCCECETDCVVCNCSHKK